MPDAGPTRDYERVEQAIAFLVEHQLEQPSLADVATELGLSAAHLQRLFSRWAGVSPKRFLQHLTIERAKALLDSTHTVLDTSYSVGLSTGSRLYDLFVSIEAVTPGEYRASGKGLEIRYGVHPSPFGDCLVANTPRGVCDVKFLVEGKRARVNYLRRRWPEATLVEDPRDTGAVAKRIFGEDRNHATLGQPLPLFLKGTNLQLAVWRALLSIPCGCVTSYGDIAEQAGSPSAVRAVGSAIGKNPISYVIPCHRVIRRDLGLGGYGSGLNRKRAMLAWEAVAAEADDRSRS